VDGVDYIRAADKIILWLSNDIQLGSLVPLLTTWLGRWNPRAGKAGAHNRHGGIVTVTPQVPLVPCFWRLSSSSFALLSSQLHVNALPTHSFHKKQQECRCLFLASATATTASKPPWTLLLRV
jgi:hypothetical protein